jgi:hypothetical protein
MKSIVLATRSFSSGMLASALLKVGRSTPAARQGWGGQSGAGYQWPSNEHGLFVDDNGFVWIEGHADGKSNNDNQILKFTNDGKFVMAIGQSGVIVFNANTGEFIRMWEDVGDQALMRGLDTAFPCVRPGRSLSGVAIHPS